MKMPNLKTIAITAAVAVVITGYLIKSARAAELAKAGAGATTLAGKLGLV